MVASLPIHKHGRLWGVRALLIPVIKRAEVPHMLPEVNAANPLDPEHLGEVINHVSQPD